MSPFLPVIAAFAVMIFGVGWRMAIHRRRYGSNAVAPIDATKWREGIPEIVIAALATLLAVEVVAWAVWPRALLSTVIVQPRAGAGSVLVLLGLAGVFRAQSDLGASWRVGIDRSARPGLVTHGIYRVSRNPIYLGVFTILTGFLLLMPTPVSVLVLAGILLAVREQVQCEERYLAEAYGDEYRLYARQVGRFVPWAGRLR